VTLTVLKVDSTDPVSAGSGFTYTITVNNPGADAPNVVVADTLPAGLTAVSASGNQGFVCGFAGQTVTCSAATLLSGQTATIIIGVTMSSPCPITNPVTNSAVIRSGLGHNQTVTHTTTCQ
jgi:uncharacterized repeat protein (TIGR01451 family)